MMITIGQILAAGGVLAVFTMPGAIWALIGLNASYRRLEERNAAQAQTIAGLQARLRPGGRYEVKPFEPWPRDEGAKLREGVGQADVMRHYVKPTAGMRIEVTDTSCCFAVDPAQQAELDRFHAANAGIR